MRWQLLPLLLAFTTMATAQPQDIVLLGGTMIQQMEDHGFLELAITTGPSNESVTVRNLGWPGDDVFGSARGEFGSAVNTRSWQPPSAVDGFGYEQLMRHLGETDPTLILVGYGHEAAFADTEEGFAGFERGYRNLIADLKATGARLVLLTPIPQVAHGHVLPDPAANNANLAKATEVISAVGAEGGHMVIDLFNDLVLGEADPETGLHPAYTNGIHLTEHGYRILARHMATALELPTGDFSIELDADGNQVSVSGATISDLTASTRGARFNLTPERLPSFGSGSITIAGDHPTRLRVDGKDVETEEGSFLAGPAFAQAEELRQVIIRKNLHYRTRIRPMNEAYISLFRQHEMGHLAEEYGDLLELAQADEQVIDQLKKPRTHRYDIERIKDWAPPREYPDHEVPQDIPTPNVAEELAAFEVSEGFEVNLFAADPMIANPISLNWDTRGRAWVSTSSTYPHIKPGDAPKDRIIILEDTDNDGVADKSTVFADKLLIPHSVMPVKGGAYVCATTEILFLADEDGDDVADSRRVVFSGFGNADIHHTIHGFRWAPWGDLQFTQSIYINSFVETAHGRRQLNGTGVWRFRPETEKLDILARGRVNPWGLAFDKWGKSFGTDGAGGSGPHYVFPGAAHGTAVGAHRVLSGLIPGKPKNTAAEFISGRHLPDHWQNELIANDYRANRTIRYSLKPEGSGYTAEEVETILHSGHRSYRPVDLKMGPDGALYVVDWYNPIIDHGEVDFHHPARDRSHGRIWRVTAKDRPLVEKPQIAGADIPSLLDLLKAPEQYTRMQANRELADRPREDVLSGIEDWMGTLDAADPDLEHHYLEALWLQMAHRRPDPDLASQLLAASSPEARAAAARVLGNWFEDAAEVDRVALLQGAVQDEAPSVRLEAINALRSIGTVAAINAAMEGFDQPVDDLIAFSLELLVRETSDVWLAELPGNGSLFGGNQDRIAFALRNVDDPRAVAPMVDLLEDGAYDDDDAARGTVIQKVAGLGDAASVSRLLTMADGSPEILTAMASGVREGSSVPSNAAGIVEYIKGTDSRSQIAASRLAGNWKLEAARTDLVKMATGGTDRSAVTAMTKALASLGAFDDLATMAGESTNRAMVRAAAIAAWVGVQPETAAGPAVAVLQTLSENADIGAVIGAFISQEEGPDILEPALGGVDVDEAIAIEATRLARASGRNMDGLVAAFSRAGGLKPAPLALTPEEQADLIADIDASGSVSRGREVFGRRTTMCINCHKVGTDGRHVGPDLTTVGTYMTPASLLESMINPATSIKQGYETIILTKKDGSIVSGLLDRKTEDATILRLVSGGSVTVPASEIASTDTSPVSLMPPGLTATLRRDEVVDLMRYLKSLGKGTASDP